MNDYVEVAKKYFRDLDGLHLYPWRSTWFQAWVVSTVVWFLALVVFFAFHRDLGLGTGIPIILVPELLWLALTFRIQTLKESRMVEETNARLGTSFSSPAECRRHVLADAVKASPPDFLRIAKEIDDLIGLQRRFRKSSDQSWAELWRRIYDRDSKARLLTLMIALLSMIVALTARSNATLETLFEVYSEPSARSFMAVISLLAATLFALTIGFQVFVRTLLDGLASWSTKLFGGSQQWLLGYLVRDLIKYYGADELKASPKPAQADGHSMVGNEISVEVGPLDSSDDNAGMCPATTDRSAEEASQVGPHMPVVAERGSARGLRRILRDLWQRKRLFAVSLTQRR